MQNAFKVLVIAWFRDYTGYYSEDGFLVAAFSQLSYAFEYLKQKENELEENQRYAEGKGRGELYDDGITPFNLKFVKHDNSARLLLGLYHRHGKYLRVYDVVAQCIPLKYLEELQYNMATEVLEVRNHWRKNVSNSNTKEDKESCTPERKQTIDDCIYSLCKEGLHFISKRIVIYFHSPQYIIPQNNDELCTRLVKENIIDKKRISQDISKKSGKNNKKRLRCLI